RRALALHLPELGRLARRRPARAVEPAGSGRAGPHPHVAGQRGGGEDEGAAPSMTYSLAMSGGPLLAIALGGLAVAGVLGWRQAWGWRGLRAVRREFPARIDRYQRAGKARIRAELLADPQVRAAVDAH